MGSSVRQAHTVCLAAVAAAHSLALGAPVCIEFDGSVPPGVTLTRATPRTDPTGAVIPANVARFADSVIAPAPQLIVSLYDFDQVVDAAEVGGQTYVAVISFLQNLRLVVGTPVCAEEWTDLTPHPSVQAKFGFNAAEWGVPRSVDILQDGSIVVHCFQAGPQRRSVTVRTTIATFENADGWSLVRVSDYAPPPTKEPAYPISTFTRATFLPNLGVQVCTIAEYTPFGLVSSVDPSDGRSLGYASTDSGQTWTRVIDTDDPALGRTLVEGAKHMHHLEPFEWFDAGANQWKVGAAGCLGDAEGESGQIWVRSPSSTFPPEGMNHLLTLNRTRAVGRRALTDLFPISNSESPGSPMRFIHGQDGELGGIVEARVLGASEENVSLLPPSVPHVASPTPGFAELPQYPFIFQMDRLTSGSILAGTTEAWNTGNPNGFWQSDVSGTRWTTVRLADTQGFNGIMPTSDNRFWAVAILGTQRPFSYIAQLWKAGDATIRTPLVLGAGAHDAVDFPVFDGVVAPGTLTPATGLIDGPPELPASATINRLTVADAPINSQFATATIPVSGAAPGDLVHIVFWVRPAPPQAGCQSFQLEPEFTTQSATTIAGTRIIVDHETNMWTRIAIVETVPPQGVASMTVRCRVISGAATAQKPIDFYATRPVLFVADQPIRQHVPVGGVAEDRLTVPVPTLGADWTIGILATEATTFAVSAVDGAGDGIFVAPAPGPQAYTGIDSRLVLHAIDGGTPTPHGQTSPQDVVVPTQTLVFLRRDSGADRIDMWVARGMGDFDVVEAPGVAATPTEVRFAAPDWSTVFEGEVHRVRIWADRALSETEMRRERLTLPGACADAPAIDPAEPVIVCPPPPPLPCRADLNNDGFTNAADFIILAGNFGGGPGLTRAQGDCNGDGYVDAADFVYLAGDFGCVFGG